MPAIGFDNQKYLTTQSEQIKKRIAQFGGKLYLEFATAKASANGCGKTGSSM